jgi:hypothetical protein
VIDVFVDALDLAELSFEGVEPAATGLTRVMNIVGSKQLMAAIGT